MKNKELYYLYGPQNLVLIIAGILALLMGLGMATFFSFMFGNPFKYLILQQRGQETTATVTQSRLRTDTTINNQHPMEIFYTFQADQGEYFGSMSTLDSEIIEKASTEKVVPIWFLAQRPQINMIVVPFSIEFSLPLVILLAFAATGIIIIFFIGKRIKKIKSILKNGEKTVGKVVNTSINNLKRVNNQPEIAITYQYTTYKGRQENVFKTYNHRNFGKLKTGDAVEVIYDKKDPKQSLLMA